MSAQILRFPARGPFHVEILPSEDGWLVRVRSYGWLHGDRAAALRDAAWLARNHGVAVREVRA